jgi:mannosylglycerate hydrolase MGH1-like protein
MTQESLRLQQDASREQPWKRWGPYLSERQWGTVREDYSADGTAWEYFPHDHARSRAYRWGEDGLLGICDRQGRLCFALALWNERDAILKERLFGLTGNEGNHGEDVKECYFYLDSTPTHSYMKALYKYPQRAFPYAELIEENRRRTKHDPEFELIDTGAFADDRYFDVAVEYAKASPNDLLIRITVSNRGSAAARLHVLPTLWFRNTWSWGRTGEGYWQRPRLSRAGCTRVTAEHESLGAFVLQAQPNGSQTPDLLFTDNETNRERLFGVANGDTYVKDAFHDYIVKGRLDAVNPAGVGTKAAFHYVLDAPAHGTRELRLRLSASAGAPDDPFDAGFERTFEDRVGDANDHYDAIIPARITGDARRVVRQAAAGLLWTKQFYHYVVKDWSEGDPAQPSPPTTRQRNSDWPHLYNRDVIAVPDKWEYPWYASWDLAFHTIPFARLDPDFAKAQILLFLREWYMHPSGQLPAYEWALSDVNPPVHAWAAWRVYKMTGAPGQRDREFLARVFQKLLLNFTWWVNRKDIEGRHLFAGGFLGLDNIGAFNRSEPLPGHSLEQADGTAWMAFYCATMLSIAIELAGDDPVYADMASKFFEHFVAIVDAMNAFGGTGLWDEADGFYYDRLSIDGRAMPMPIRSMVGLLPLCAVEVLEQDAIDRLPGFKKRLEWFLINRPDLARHITYMESSAHGAGAHRLLAIPSRDRLVRMLRYMLDEREFLSPFGVRSVSRVHEAHPFTLRYNSVEHRVAYTPGESTTTLFGGNSNWRGPIWLPMNYLLVEALERYHHFYGDALTVECPTGSGRQLTLRQVATEISCRLASLFLRDASGRRPCHGDDRRYADDPHWRDLLLFHEYFHGDNGRGCGASHQTGWTALAARFIDEWARSTGR